MYDKIKCVHLLVCDCLCLYSLINSLRMWVIMNNSYVYMYGYSYKLMWGKLQVCLCDLLSKCVLAMSIYFFVISGYVFVLGNI